MRKAIALLLLAILSAYSNQPDAVGQEVPVPGRGESSASATIPDVPDATQTLDAEQIKRLRVEWSPPQRLDARGRAQEPTIEIQGKLSLLQADGKTLLPVEGPLPICVLLAKKPEAKPNWSRRHSESDSLETIILVGWKRGILLGDREADKAIPLPKGGFVARFQLAEIHIEPGKTQPFQVGFCLAEKNGKTISWRNTLPVLPQTVQMINIPGPQPMSRTLQLINACPTPIGWGYDPMTVVRAANHLRSLGKEKAVASLRDFLKIAYDAGYTRERVDPANIDTSNQWCLATLVPVLFPNLREGYGQRIVVWQGIPFHTVVIKGTSGSPGPTRPLVDRAEKEGKLLDQPLRPADDLLAAADSLFAKIGKAEERVGQSNKGLQQHLREQAWRSIRHLVHWRSSREPDFRYEVTWTILKEKAEVLKIRWDEQKQEYVAGEKPQ